MKEGHRKDEPNGEIEKRTGSQRGGGRGEERGGGETERERPEAWSPETNMETNKKIDKCKGTKANDTERATGLPKRKVSLINDWLEM